MNVFTQDVVHRGAHALLHCSGALEPRPLTMGSVFSEDLGENTNRIRYNPLECHCFFKAHLSLINMVIFFGVCTFLGEAMWSLPREVDPLPVCSMFANVECCDKHIPLNTRWGPQDRVQLSYKWLNSIVYGRYHSPLMGSKKNQQT